MKGRTYRYFNDPLFAFGYGMSYTTFEIGDAQIKNWPHENADGIRYDVSIPVKNTGVREGKEVVQLYIRNLSDPNGPLKSLRAFKGIRVKPGQTETVVLTLDKKSFEFWDEGTNSMHTKVGQYEILYGTSSRDKDLKRVTITLE